MHSADAVVYPVERSRRAAWGLALIWLAGAAGTLIWCATVPASASLRFLALLWAGAAGAAAARWWWRSGLGRLCWDGQAWSIEGAAGRANAVVICQARAEVVVDLQNMLLLRLQAQRRIRWVLLDRSAAPLRWHGLRCAVTAAVFMDGAVSTADGARP